jgi:predicted nucleotidyltransferase
VVADGLAVGVNEDELLRDDALFQRIVYGERPPVAVPFKVVEAPTQIFLSRPALTVGSPKTHIH